MATDIDRTRKLAILIDADNASPKMAAAIFEEIATIGEASARRIFGDFSSPHLQAWKEVIGNFAIVPNQNFATTVGKNASDIALVIDAMDLLHSGRFDGFCIVSSDSDFTRLAARIREQGVDVFGFGEKKTPASFRSACKRFIYVENLIPQAEALSQPPDGTGVVAAAGAPAKLPPGAAVPLILTAISQLEDVDGWHFLGAVGTRLAALMPDFDPRSYGCPKLLTLIEKSEGFDVRRDNLKVHIRPKRGGPAKHKA
jgi:hypothetical protein